MKPTKIMGRVIDITPQLESRRNIGLRPFDIAYAEIAGIPLDQLLKESDELRDLTRNKLEEQL